MAGPTPLEDLVVNDRFWLKYARTSIESASKGRLATAEKLITGVGWFWTVYTGVAVLGVTAADRDLDNWRTFLVFLPVPALGFTYLVALWAATAIEGTYDPRVPSQVKAAYITAAEERKRRIKAVLLALAISALMVVIAGGAVASLSDESPSESSIAVTVSSSSTVLVEVVAHKGAAVAIEVLDADGTAVHEELVTADDNGRAAVSAPIDEATRAGGFTVTSMWTADKATFTATRSVEATVEK